MGDDDPAARRWRGSPPAAPASPHGRRGRIRGPRRDAAGCRATASSRWRMRRHARRARRIHGRALCRRRRQHHRPPDQAGIGHFGQPRRLRQGHTGTAVGLVQRCDRAMQQDRPDRRIEPAQDPLRLAEGIAEHHAGPPGGRVGSPPVVDVGEDLRLRRPAVDRQAEGRFGDEGVAANRLECLAGAVVLELVVAGDHPDLAAVLQPHLRRPEHMAGRMQAQPHAMMLDRLAVGQQLQVDVAEPGAQHRLGASGREVVAAAGPRMVAVRMSDHRALDRPPRIDVETAGRAVESFRHGRRRDPHLRRIVRCDKQAACPMR